MPNPAGGRRGGIARPPRRCRVWGVDGGLFSGDLTGRGLAFDSDYDGDGLSDILIGAANADPGGRMDAGSFHLVLGRSGGFPEVFELADLLPEAGGDGSAGLVSNGPASFEFTDAPAVGAGGDLDGDGRADLVLGASSADVGGRADAGRSYVVHGGTGVGSGSFELADLSPSQGGDGSLGSIVGGLARETRRVAPSRSRETSMGTA